MNNILLAVNHLHASAKIDGDDIDARELALEEAAELFSLSSEDEAFVLSLFETEWRNHE